MEDIRTDKEVQIIEKEAPAFVDKVNALQIANERDGKFANDLMVGIKMAITKLEDRRKHFVGPLNDHIRTVNAEFKALTEPLRNALAAVKNKMLGYQVAVRKKEEAEVKKKRDATTEFLGEEKALEVPPPERKKPTVVSSMGSSFLKKVWDFKVVDLGKVPDEYKFLNETKVRHMIKAHIKVDKGVSNCDLKIPGIEVYQKDQLGVR